MGVVIFIPQIENVQVPRDFAQCPRHPEENRWLPIYSLCRAYMQYVCSIILFPRLSGYFCGERTCAVKRGLTVHTVKSGQSGPPSATIRVDRSIGGGADGRVLLAAFSTTWKSTHPTKSVRAFRTPTEGQELGVVQTHQKPGFAPSLVKRVGTVAYISNQVEDASAVQYGLTHLTESYEDTINHFADKKPGRGALAGFYGTCQQECT